MPALRRLLLLVLPAALLLGVHGWTAPAAASGGRWPVSPPVVLRGFSPPAESWLPGHRGIDLAAGVGDTVRAPVDGTVTFAGPLAGRGVVVVSLPDGLRTTFEPVLAEVAVGDAVLVGEPLGTVEAGPHCGWTPCLHWGLRRDAAYLDPRTVLGLLPPVLLPLDALDGPSGWPGDAGRSASVRVTAVTGPPRPTAGAVPPAAQPGGDGGLPAGRCLVGLLGGFGELAPQLQHRLGVHLADA